MIAALLAWMTLLSFPSWAGLGEHESVIEVERARMSARRHVAVKPAYTVHELVQQDGSRVRQFATPSGTVFAVTWNSPFKPNLSGMLGTSYPTYVKVAREHAPTPGPVRAFRHQGLDLVVQSVGHLQVYSGYAYRLSLLPRGLSVDQLRKELVQ